MTNTKTWESPVTLTLEERRILCRHEGGYTLNGEKATVGGVRNDFATVMQLRSGFSAEWSWPTVARIVAAGGNFVS